MLLLENQAKFGQFCNVGAVGCRVLWQSCGNSAEAGATCGFWSRAVYVLASKTQNIQIWQKTLREYFGFSAGIQRNILKGKSPSPNGQDFLPLDEVLVLPHPSHNRKQPKLRVLFRVDAHLWPICVFLCQFDAEKVLDVCKDCCFFFLPQARKRNPNLNS